MLRLCEGDDLGLRIRFPFLLLEANRDDDASNFVRYWLKDHYVEESAERYEESSEGDWIYPRENDARFLNFLESLSTENKKYLDLSMLVAAACIKMRLVAIEMSHTRAIEAYNSTILGSRGNSVISTVGSMLPGGDIRLKGQREQLDRLLDIIHEKNPTALPALLNPGPLLKGQDEHLDLLLEGIHPSDHELIEPGHFIGHPRSCSTSPGSHMEAYFVLENAFRIWTRIPGASEVLEERFGRNPRYDATFGL